ncbi:hypothetical protein RHGRI_025785 [Rhododendron griersonianum]|uniref:Protein kinase domain-containing protein n=1 Tax=Rhododendron griersonianum TaxID=479676 RepID=A0AAV6IUX7_9ERIC|nr:hypothetical protein RHGRI_025785 [Rhododendron griersonianum]
MEQILQIIIIAAGTFVVGIILFTAARRNNCVGKIPITQTPAAATELSVATLLPKPVSMAELLEATHNFSPDLIIGHGSFGSDRVLIYKSADNGSLDQWLPLDTPFETPTSRLPSSWKTKIQIAEKPRSSRRPLSWETRIKIVRDVASGLVYMHNFQTPIIHRNIKASIVWLDNDFEPHIGDFGLARRIDGSLSHVSTQAAGTMGYMPPEHVQGATMATAMGDVYSFGILMLEISTGIRPDSPFKEEINGKGVSFVEWAREKVAQNLHMEILDANISRAGLEEPRDAKFEE